MPSEVCCIKCRTRIWNNACLNKIVTLSAKDADTLCSLPHSEFGEILLMNFINNEYVNTVFSCPLRCISHLAPITLM